MNVLIISPFAAPNLGGVESHIDKLMAYAQKKNIFPILLTYQPLTRNVKGAEEELTANYEIHRINWPGYDLFNKFENYFPLQFLYLFPGLFYLSFTYMLKNAKKIKCIHAHGLAAAAVTKILKAFFHKRSVVSTHAVYSFSNRKILAKLVKWLLGDFDAILAVSEVSKQELIGLGLNASKIFVHPNWVATDTFTMRDKSECKKILGLKMQSNVLFVGRFIEKKGVELLLEAAQKLPEIGFNFVGNGACEDQVLKASQEYPNVIYHGVLMQDNPKQKDKLIDLYNACDFFVSPYLYDEGFSTTLVEAIACGTPVVVPNRGSPPTFLDPTCAEFLNYEPTVAEIISVLTKLSSENRFDRQVCRNFALTKFGDQNADVIINSYGN